MQRFIRDFLDRVEIANSPGQLGDAIAGLIGPLDFNAFAFLALSNKSERPLLISNYDKKWQTHYIAQGYQDRDPVMLHSRHASDLFMWGSEMAAGFGSTACDFFHEAESFDIRSGVTVPIPEWPNGFAAMTFATDRRRAQLTTCLRCNRTALLFVTAHFHNHLRRMREPIRLVEGAELTPREYECLKWAARGKSQSDIVQITGISSRSVARDIENLRAKLGVRSITQAIAIFAAYEATRTKKLH